MSSSQLIPAALIESGTLPALFFEARIHGQTDTFIPQLGLSLSSSNVDVAVFTRTSGIVLVASVGSYCAYRICTKYLGKNFVWTLLDAARMDGINRADSRLLHPAAEGFFYPRRSGVKDDAIDEGQERLGALRNEIEDGEEHPQQRHRLTYTRSGSPIRILCTDTGGLRRRSRTASGLAVINTRTANPTAVSTRAVLGYDEDALSNIDTKSDLTSVSRILPAQITTNAIYDVDGDILEDTDISRAPSSVRLEGADLSWDDEIVAENIMFDEESICLSDMSEIRRFEEMMADVSAHDVSNMSIADDNESCINLQDINEMINSKSSANYMCLVTATPDRSSRAPSLISRVSIRSSLKKPKPHNQQQHALTQVSRSVEKSQRVNEPQQHDHILPTIINVVPVEEVITETGDAKQMTDSCFSRSSLSSVHQQPTTSFTRSNMFDSAISTDFQSSEDDHSSVLGLTLKPQKPMDIPKKSWLDKIIEQSPRHQPRPPSVCSSLVSFAQPDQTLEWEDDEQLKYESHETEI